jgi:hypothetical protein
MNKVDAIAKAKKIQALALRGATEGERTAAQHKLSEFMQAHGLTEKDITGSSHRVKPSIDDQRKHRSHRSKEFTFDEETIRMITVFADILIRSVMRR